MTRYIEINPFQWQRMSKEEKEKLRAEQTEESCRMVLESRGIDPEIRKNHTIYLSNALLKQGKLAEAHKAIERVTGMNAERRHLRNLIKAEAAADDERCNCPKVVISVERRPNQFIDVEHSNYSARETHFSQKYGRFVTFYECATCGHINTLPNEIDRGAKRVAKSKENALPDHELLPSVALNKKS